MGRAVSDTDTIVVVTVDSLQYDYVATNGDVPIDLPVLSSLSADGAFFENAFSTASITKSAFLTIFSGTYPWMFGSNSGGFGPDRPHVATILGDGGYATAGFNTNPYLSRTYGFDRGFDYYMGRDTDETPDPTTAVSKYWPIIKESVPGELLWRAIRSTYGTVGERFGVQLGGDPYPPAEAVHRRVFDWLERTNGPRFLWIHYMDVHTPYYPREGTVSEGIDHRRAIRLFHRANEQGADTPTETLETLERLYRGEVQHLDRKLGELLAGLETSNDLDETLFLFTSDHGEAFGAHDAVFHPDGKLFDEQIHVPLVVRGPGFDVGPVSTPVSTADLLPTVLSAAGEAIPDACVGDSLADIVADPPADRTVYAQGQNPETGLAMVTDERFKLVRDLETGTETLYDRAVDPAESTDHGDAQPDVAARLRGELDAALRVARSNAADVEAVDVDEEVKTRLQMLGYDE
jgi:arylsulfatase A-like enzyme